MITLINNLTSEYEIIRGDNASPSEITAANELQSYIKKISGVEIPIRTDVEPIKKYEIIIGKTNRETTGEFDRNELGDDGFIIKHPEKNFGLLAVNKEEHCTAYMNSSRNILTVVSLLKPSRLFRKKKL